MNYVYNGDGALVSETAGANTTRYLLDPTGGQSERLSRTSNGTTTVYLRGWGAELADETGGTANWYVTDRLGSVRATTDAGGTISAQYRYDAWGSPTTPAATYGFTGEPQTAAGGGLLYLRARWYRLDRRGSVCQMQLDLRSSVGSMIGTALPRRGRFCPPAPELYPALRPVG